MVVSLKPPDYKCDEDKMLVSPRVLPTRIREFQPFFWKNYRYLRPLIPIESNGYCVSEYKFLDSDGTDTFFEKMGTKILGHRVYEGKAYFLTTKTRSKRLRNIKSWILAEELAESEPSKVGFYIMKNSLFYHDEAWDFVQDLFYALGTFEDMDYDLTGNSDSTESTDSGSNLFAQV